MVVQGRERGKSGRILRVLPEKKKVIVEKINFVKKHTRPHGQQKRGGILEKEAHTPSFKANLRHITQVAIELEKQDGELFFKAIKIEGRFSRSAFLPKHYEVWDEEIIFPSIGGRRPGNLGDKIRTLRKKIGMTQKELAEQVGLTPSFISQLEKNLSPFENY
jgi:ribosomal protein L24